MRIGIIFSDKNVEALKARNLSAAAISPACSVDETRVAKILGVPIFNLNDFVNKGEMAPLSRDCASFIRTALHGTKLPPEAIASQNDVYQYHLRKQYLFHTALKRFLESNHISSAETPTLVMPVLSMKRYESPMRPELNRFFDDSRTFGYIAQQLATNRDVRTEFVDHRFSKLTWLADFIILPVRKLVLQLFALAKLAKKAWNTKLPSSTDARTIGIIVRTDSEVISAKALIDEFKALDVRTIVIQDELLASETTASRLDAIGISYVSIGSTLGLRGISYAVPYSTAVKRREITKSILHNLGEKPKFMDISAAEWASWFPQRLFDFSQLQRHFAAELARIIHSRDLKILVTFAYVDQWGPIIQNAGAITGIKTICIQNAAQDPEEYPHLAWSDHYCVESTYLKSRLIELGYPKTKITATGLPHYAADTLGQHELIPTTDKPAILLITQPIYHTYYIELIQWLAPFCAQHNLELHVRYHPRQSGDEYAEVLDHARSICIVKVFHRETLELSLQSARVCISVVSAAILKAVNLGIPTISFLPKSEKYLDLYYCSESNLFVAQDLEILKKILQEMAEDFSSFWSKFKQLRQNYLDNHLSVEPSNDSVKNILGVINAHIS